MYARVPFVYKPSVKVCSCLLCVQTVCEKCVIGVYYKYKTVSVYLVWRAWHRYWVNPVHIKL